MKEYLLLFRSNDTETKDYSPEQMQENMKHWQEWIGGIAQKGILVGAQPLEKGGKVINRGRGLTDGAFMEGKEVLGGYVLLKAASIEEASRHAEACPILELESGTVEIREVGTMAAM